VGVEARIQRTLHGVRLAVARQRDQIGTSRPERAHAPRDLVAVHLGQADVDQRDLGMMLAGELECAWPGAGGVDTMSFELEERAQRFASVLVVFDDENGAPGRRRAEARSGIGFHVSLSPYTRHDEDATEPLAASRC